jgi:hypothetical protein
MLGNAAVAMWWDIAPEARAEWEDWHSHEHMPERLGIPGFLRGTRSIAVSGEPSYFVLYEVRQLAVMTGGVYLERLNQPTPWSQKMMPHHRNMVRSLCRVRASFGGGVAQAVATLRFSPGRKSPVKRLTSEVLPALPQRKGLAGAHLLQSLPAERTPQTAEQKMRGGADARADWVLLVNGYDVDALRAVVEKELAPALPGAAQSYYRVAYSLTPKDLA